MKSRESKVKELRKNLEKINFYEDIIFKDKAVSKEVKENVAKWIFNLQEYRDIEVRKFKELFSKLDEIIFPIKIKESYGCNLDIKFLDAQGNEYYMSKRDFYDYCSLPTYIIGRRNSPLEPLVDREFHYQIYQISEGENIRLAETGIMQLNQDGTNKDIVVDFIYNSDEYTTEAILRSYSSNNKIKIKYPTVSAEFDKLVLKFLFDNESKWYYYDVYPILKWIATVISNQKVSISVVAEIEEEIFSEIDVVNGIVQKYTITKIINEGEMHIIKKLFAKDLKKFLDEKS